jgi:hypothetical protein
MSMSTTHTPTNRYPTDGYTFQNAIDVAARKATRNGGRYAVSMTSAHGARFYTVSEVAAR